MARTELEIAHGRKICGKTEHIWGWGTRAGKRRVERRADSLIEFGAIDKGKKVLEIGCGTGIFTEKIAATGADIAAVDISPDLINKARKNVEDPNVSFYIANVENMDFEDNSFDSVVGSSILHHLNVEPALLEIRRLLKKEGRIAFTEPNMMNPQIAIERKIKPIGKMLYNSPDEIAFFRWSVKKLLKKLGFEKIFIKPFDFLHPLTPDFLNTVVNKIGLDVEKIPIIKEISGSLLITAETLRA